MYIHELSDWPKFIWSHEVLSKPLASARYEHGRLIGQIENLGFKLKQQSVFRTLAQDVVKTNELDGLILEPDKVKSTLAKRLGVGSAGSNQIDREVDAVLRMTLDATINFPKPVSTERLFSWHAALFPTGWSGMFRIKARSWREGGTDQVPAAGSASGNYQIQFQPPVAQRLDEEMRTFLKWFEQGPEMDFVLKAGVAQLWFLTIQPFDGGNGQIARALADILMMRAEESSHRFFSMSAQICREQRVYFDMLERTQQGTMDITQWLDWFLACFGRSVAEARTTLATILRQVQFWELVAPLHINDRQRGVLNALLDENEERVTSSKWAKLAGCSQDTAHRDILYLLDRGILKKETKGGRSTGYSLAQGTAPSGMPSAEDRRV
jgi:Fic family protein